MRLKAWHWVALGLAFVVYVVLATFQVYGGFYIGSPPLTPAWLNNTRIPIRRVLRLEHQSLLRVTGEVRLGRINLKLDGKSLGVLLGQLNNSYVLGPGLHLLVFENDESAGMINYSVH